MRGCLREGAIVIRAGLGVVTGSRFWIGLDEAAYMLHPNHRQGSINAAGYAPEELLIVALVAAHDLYHLRLQLVALLCKSPYDLPVMFWNALLRLGGYLQHRKEYKNVPTDKCG